VWCEGQVQSQPRGLPAAGRQGFQSVQSAAVTRRITQPRSDRLVSASISGWLDEVKDKVKRWAVVAEIAKLLDVYAGN
jgi:hypothetical protein